MLLYVVVSMAAKPPHLTWQIQIYKRHKLICSCFPTSGFKIDPLLEGVAFLLIHFHKENQQPRPQNWMYIFFKLVASWTLSMLLLHIFLFVSYYLQCVMHMCFDFTFCFFSFNTHALTHYNCFVQNLV